MSYSFRDLTEFLGSNRDGGYSKQKTSLRVPKGSQCGRMQVQHLDNYDMMQKCVEQNATKAMITPIPRKTVEGVTLRKEA